MAKAKLDQTERRKALDGYFAKIEAECGKSGVHLDAPIPLYGDPEYYVSASDGTGRATDYVCPAYDIGPLYDDGYEPRDIAATIRADLDRELRYAEPRK